MKEKCRNCKYLVIEREGEFICSYYYLDISPDYECEKCSHSIICYTLLDRVPILEKLYQK